MQRKNFIKFISNSDLVVGHKTIFHNLIKEKRNNLEITDLNSIWDNILGTVFDLFSEIINAEIEIATKAGLIKDQRRIYEDFYLRVSQNDEWQAIFFENYPLLKVKLENKIKHIIDYVNFVIDRVSDDIDLLIQKGLCTNSNLTTIKFTSGDTHNHTCTVLLKFEAGEEIYFKPKSLEGDIFINETISQYLEKWIGRDISVHVINLNMGDYGYSVSVNSLGCETDQEINDYYYNYGCLSAYCNLFGIEDLIYDNVIAKGDKVALIDLECILSPSKRFYESISICKENGAFHFFSHSLFHSGILPRYSMTDSSNILANDSSLTYREENMNESIVNQNRHLPIKGDNVVDVKNYCSTFIDGYIYTYNILITKKQELKLIAKSIFNLELSPRVIIRPTIFYSKMIQHIIHPVSLTSEKEYQDSVNFILRDENNIFEKKIIDSEIIEIEQLNIPCFHSSPTTRNLYDNDGNVVVENYFLKSGLDLLFERIANLSAEDLQKQLEIIKNSFKVHYNYDDFSAKKNFRFIQSEVLNSPEPKKRDEKLSIEKVKEQVEEIAEYILSKNLDTQTPGWIDISLNNFEMYEQSVLPPGLAHGTDGIALFLGLAGNFCKNDKYKEVAKKIIFDNGSVFLNYKNFDYLHTLYTSPYIYPLSSVYTTMYLKDILSIDENYVDSLIQAYFNYTKKFMYKAESFCLLNGLVGNVFLLNSIHKINLSEETVETAVEIGDYLIKNCRFDGKSAAWKTKEGYFLGGYSHGSASYSNAFMLLYDITHEQRFLDFALYSLNYDKSTYNNLTQEYRDLRYEDINKYSSSWAHGSAGIALSRITNNFLGLKCENEELQICRNSILRNNKGELHTLMNGFWGNLEILRAVESQLKLPERNYLEILNKILTIKSKAVSWRSALPWNHVSLGMFGGLCGVGYSLIRHSNWRETPSILSLELNDGFIIDNLHK